MHLGHVLLDTWETMQVIVHLDEDLLLVSGQDTVKTVSFFVSELSPVLIKEFKVFKVFVLLEYLFFEVFEGHLLIYVEPSLPLQG